MGALTTVLAATALTATAAKGVVDFANAQKEAKAARAEGDYEAGLFELSAQLADQQAADAIARGREGAGRLRVRGRTLLGSQRAAFAGQGIDVGVGSPLDVMASDQALNEIDILTLQNNAAREAWGIRAEASLQRGRAGLARLAGRNRSRHAKQQGYSTLLTTVSSLANQASGMSR